MMNKLQKQIMNIEDLDFHLENIAESCNYEDSDGQFYNGIRINEDTILVLMSYWGVCNETEYFHYSISKNEFVKVDDDKDNYYRELFEDCDMLDSYNCFYIIGISPTKDGKAEINYGDKDDYNDTIVDLEGESK